MQNENDSTFNFNYRAKELHRFLTDMDYQQRVLLALYDITKLPREELDYEYLS